MTILNAFKDTDNQCWARGIMSSGEPFWISVAQDAIMIKKSRIGLLGPKLYYEDRIYNSGNTARILWEQYGADDLTPENMNNLILKSFVNAVLHCNNASDVVTVVNTAFK